jgi:hypothetical protein
MKLIAAPFTNITQTNFIAAYGNNPWASWNTSIQQVGSNSGHGIVDAMMTKSAKSIVAKYTRAINARQADEFPAGKYQIEFRACMNGDVEFTIDVTITE